MSANRKKTLFIALGSLLASSTAVAVLTFQTGVGFDADAATSAGAVNGAEHAEETSAPFYPLSLESVRYPDAFSTLDWGNKGPVVIGSKVDMPFETYSALSDVVGATDSAVMPSFFYAGFGAAANRFSLNHREFGGGSHIAGRPSSSPPGSSGPKDPSSDFDSSVPSDTNAHRPDPDTQGGPCDILTGCGSLDDVPGSVPGSDSPSGGSPVTTKVPEPGSMGLLAFGLSLVGFMGRRRRAPI